MKKKINEESDKLGLKDFNTLVKMGVIGGLVVTIYFIVVIISFLVGFAIGLAGL